MVIRHNRPFDHRQYPGTTLFATQLPLDMKVALRAILLCVAVTIVGGGCSSRPAEVNGEQVPANEAGAIASAIASLHSSGGHDAYPGCVRAKVTIDPELPAALKHGVFAHARTYPARIRFSDGETGRGMAIEVTGAEGARLIPDGARTQDLVMTDFPVYFAATAADYAAYATALEHGTLGDFLTATPSVGRILAATNGQTVDNLFTQRYFSMTPYRLGSTYIKFSARPAPCPLPSRLGSADESDPSGLRAQMVSDLSRGDACFELQLQPRTDPTTMPIEDASVLWDESKAPFVDAAFIDIPKQSFDGRAQQASCQDHLDVTPWHGTVDFRPVGGINRLFLAAGRRF